MTIPPMANEWMILLRLAFSVLLGGLIGIERERANHEAGLRTHILVCLGSAGLMVLSELIRHSYDCDMQRIAAGVVSGIGFLGAGCILVSGNRIKGLTTAAGLWTTSCVGMAAGMGYYLLSGIITVLMLLTMFALAPLRRWAHSHGNGDSEYILRVQVEGRDAVRTVTEQIDAAEQHITSLSLGENGALTVKLTGGNDETLSQLLCQLMETPGVLSTERLN